MIAKNRKNRYSIIHVAKKQLGLDDDAYRAILSGAGLTSSKDINTDAQFNNVMSAFQSLGFKSTNKRMNTVSGAPGMISKKQEYYIKGLWQLVSRFKDEASLRRIVKRIGKVDDVSFLPKRAASAVILALRDICWKAGFNPDKKEEVYVHKSKNGGEHSSDRNPACVFSLMDGRNRSDKNWKTLAAGSGIGE